MSIFQAANWAKDTVYDLWQLSLPAGHGHTEATPPKWQVPNPGGVKVNTDAAFLASKNHGATACF
jgi:hypothetical protein